MTTLRTILPVILVGALLSAVATRALPVQIFDHRFLAAVSRTLLILKVSRTSSYGGDVFSRPTVPLTAS